MDDVSQAVQFRALGPAGGPVHGRRYNRQSSLRLVDWTDRLLGTLKTGLVARLDDMITRHDLTKIQEACNDTKSRDGRRVVSSIFDGSTRVQPTNGIPRKPKPRQPQTTQSDRRRRSVGLVTFDGRSVCGLNVVCQTVCQTVGLLATLATSLAARPIRLRKPWMKVSVTSAFFDDPSSKARSRCQRGLNIGRCPFSDGQFLLTRSRSSILH